VELTEIICLITIESDIDTAMELASEVIGMSLDDLSIPARDLLFQLNEMLPEGKERQRALFTRTDVMNHTCLHIHLKELICSKTIW
jgi:hypothetical protein